MTFSAAETSSPGPDSTARCFTTPSSTTIAKRSGSPITNTGFKVEANTLYVWDGTAWRNAGAVT